MKRTRAGVAPNASDGVAGGDGPAQGAAAEPPQRRFVKFETSNPAVSVTQKEDGSYDIQNRDPALAGTVMQVTAVSPSGAATKVMIRIP